MNRAADLIVIILIWGFLIYLFAPAISSGLGGGEIYEKNGEKSGLLATISDSFYFGPAEPETIKEIIILSSDEKDFKNAEIILNDNIGIFSIEVFPKNHQIIFASTDSGFLKSEDGGFSWRPFYDLGNKIDSKTKIYKTVFKEEKNGVLSFIAAFKNGKGFVYKSDGNFFFLEKILELDAEAVYDMSVFGDYVYMGLSDGKILRYSIKNNDFQRINVFSSAIFDIEVKEGGNLIYSVLNNGKFFSSKDGGVTFINGKIDKLTDFKVSRFNDFEIYGGTEKELIKSSDAGLTWEKLNPLPSQKPLISAITLGNKKGEIFASVMNKFYKSEDDGLSWQIYQLPTDKEKEILLIVLNDDKIIVGINN